MAENHKLEDLAEVDRKYVGDDYKREVVEHMSIPQLVDTIMINPTVGQRGKYWNNINGVIIRI